MTMGGLLNGRGGLWSPPLAWCVILTLGLAFGQAMPDVRFFSSPAQYLPVHTVLEFVAMAVSAMVFALAWNLRRRSGNSDTILLGAGFMAVCLIDLGHTLSYAGMPDLLTPSGPEKAINFWLAGRYVAAVVLLGVALIPLRTWPMAAGSFLLGAAALIAVVVWWAALGYSQWFPRTFVPGEGLTAFKIGAEYLLIALYAFAAWRLIFKARITGNANLRWLAAAAWIQGLAEMFFTLYADVTDLFNLLGHLYKAIAYLMVYQGMFVSGVVAPYRELKLERSRLSALLSAIPDPVFVKDANGVFMSCNKAFERLLGVGEKSIQGKTDYDFFDKELADFFREKDRAAMQAGQPLSNEEWLTFAADGYRGLFETTKQPLYVGGTAIGTLGIAHDITRRQQVETDLRLAAAAFESQTAMLVTDANGVILRVNKAFTDDTGYAPEECIGQTPRLLRSGRHDTAFYVQMWKSIRRSGAWQGEIWDRRKDGSIYPKWLTISAVRGDSGVVTHYIGLHQDISERKQAETRIHHLAYFDQLTGLPNRVLILERLREVMRSGTTSGSHGALLCIDLDNFKNLNDTLGHNVGDLLLKEVGDALRHCVRENDIVGRLGGDEFVVIMTDVGATEEAARQGAEAAARYLQTELGRTFRLGSIVHRNAASIGVTIFKGEHESIESLMRQIDLAMYKAKGAGRNAIRFFDPGMELAVRERAALEEDLRYALEEEQFLLHYQVQIGEGGRVEGAEVLLRWQHPERGMVSPAVFIPLAEETGDIVQLGSWVLEQAASQLARWAGSPDTAHLALAVNVSAVQLHQPDFVERVTAILRQAGADPGRLKLELTESMLVEDIETTISKMQALKELGITFALDDFGTGYSSLSYLKRLPLSQLKIDQSFVRDVLLDPNDAAIARSIVALAQGLGLGVIAEGVETEEQREFLAASGCHRCQGYLFGRPVVVAEFERLVREMALGCQP
ncbi:MAG: diguanylate cyclase/phosphodiesterase with sensor(s) [Proteobacteria bacterium]|nr:diguanylate cyclase/phosphodiesterase with sensor(s) [Pseudomonadota bacterium]